MSLLLYGIVGFASLGIAYLHYKNQKEAEEIKKEMRRKRFMVEKEKNERILKEKLEKRKLYNIQKLKENKYNKYPISSIIIELLEDSDAHTEIEEILNEKEIKEIECKLGFLLPTSYKIFLRHFGDGGAWVYANSIDHIKNYSFLKDYRKSLNATIELVEHEQVQVDSLLCLMSEDSNGGAWVWLTEEEKEDNEWSLAYYSSQHKKLFYKVENFTEWLHVLVKSKNEVITELDKNYQLGLG